MKHGIAYAKLSRTSSHRMLMLRNLVTSLFEHERIKTTLPKAQAAARLAEKMITLGKRGDLPSHRSATDFLLNRDLVPKLFTTFAERYANRPGGYTRVHKYGRRPGDNAPVALLELVDGPQDLRFALTARAVGRETLALKLHEGNLRNTIKEGVPEVQRVVDQDMPVHYKRKGLLNGMTRLNLQKVLRYRNEEAKQELVQQAQDHADRLLSQPIAALHIGARPLAATLPAETTTDAKTDSKTDAASTAPKDDPSAPPIEPKTKDALRKRTTLLNALNTPGGARPHFFGGRPAVGGLGITQLKQKGQDPLRLTQKAFIKPKKVPRWLAARPGLLARPKLGVAVPASS